jgi:hypothetical protein
MSETAIIAKVIESFFILPPSCSQSLSTLVRVNLQKLYQARGWLSNRSALRSRATETNDSRLPSASLLKIIASATRP